MLSVQLHTATGSATVISSSAQILACTTDVRNKFNDDPSSGIGKAPDVNSIPTGKTQHKGEREQQHVTYLLRMSFTSCMNENKQCLLEL